MFESRINAVGMPFLRTFSKQLYYHNFSKNNLILYIPTKLEKGIFRRFRHMKLIGKNLSSSYMN